MEPLILRILVLVAGVLGLGFVGYLIATVLRESPGTEKMRDISHAIRQGAMAFLRREFTTLAGFTVVVFIILAVFIEPKPLVAIAYVCGTFTSAFAGWLGMNIATLANARTANAAIGGWARGLKIAFSSGAVMGFTVVSLGLLGLSIIAFIWEDNHVWLGFAFGASSVALFLRAGGGIFTKSADVGADLVGKVEKGIPEDDPRNPAVIADNVGDNVGDVAGMGSDLYESYVSAIAASMVLGVIVLGAVKGMLLPLLLSGVGIVVSVIGALSVRPKEVEADFEKQVARAHATMNMGVYVSNILMIVASFFIIKFYVGELGLFWALIVGLIAGFLIAQATEYFTSAEHSPTKKIARAAQSGAAVTIIEGVATGMMSTVLPVILVAIATVFAYIFGGLLGIAIASMGMLINLGMLLAMDCYGPIADNSAGIAQMAGLGKEVRERCEALDSVGNTTAALGKGFAIASAALASLAWLATYFEVAGIDIASLTSVSVIAGVLIGGMLTFVFCALAMRGVGDGAFAIVSEVRRQFREIKGLMEGEAKPDYVSCVDIATKMALKSMLLPGILVLSVPLVLGFTLGPESVAGLLMGALLTGFLIAVMMANAGGAWDNAKKFIEAGNFGGKGSEAHKAAVIGDTVGDPFKDTAGPSLNILIKLVGKVAVIFGPVFIMLVTL
ncbi:MAG TPA: sodium-translocating pyrophosphatase [Dehalococcoidia bacterium]|nr:sodium-translocating pyrophosphatase [Dehalococcoidia bacterium]